MALVLTALGVNASDPSRLASFWARALGWDVRHGASGTVDLVPTDGTRFRLTFHPAEFEAKTTKNRLHLDLTTTSAEDQKSSVETLIALGARHADVGQRPDEPHVVLVDLEGNEFCVIEPENGFLAGCERLGSITCDGAPAVGYFWSAALGWPLVWDQDDETAIRAPDSTGPFITWGGPPIPKVTRNRLFLDVAVPPGADPRAEIDRLVSLGARHAGVEPNDEVFAAMQDPDGNEFRVVSP